ncbi:MAG: leucine-rich repeat domain-containing protein [Clostridia bacterium]|nr:leucine-rich repeat domain-containing protein [Clostridia bacterium]
MAYKILEENGVDNENVDGAALNNFIARDKSGIVNGVLSECVLTATGSQIGVSPGLLLIHGIRVKITEMETLGITSAPIEATEYQIVAQVVLGSSGGVGFSLFLQLPATLTQEELYVSNHGTYQVELGRFTHATDGSITNLKQTLQIIGEAESLGGSSISEWDSTVTYKDGDIVYRDGNIYLCIADSADTDPPETLLGDSWELISKGENPRGELSITATFNIAEANTVITLKNLVGMTSIDWGDGTVDSNLTHTYTTIGEYIAKIYSVTAIGVNIVGNDGLNGFLNCKPLTKLTIGNSVTEISTWGIGRCDNLVSVTIPDSVTSIRACAFAHCYNLTSINIPYGITSIPDYCFRETGLTSIEIPESVTSIGYVAFSVCSNLKTVTIKATTPPTLGEGVFGEGTNLTKIIVPLESLGAYKNAEGWSNYATLLCCYVTSKELDWKLDKVTLTRGVYGTDYNGAQTTYRIDFANTASVNRIPFRGLNGSIMIPDESFHNAGVVEDGLQAVNKNKLLEYNARVQDIIPFTDIYTVYYKQNCYLENRNDTLQSFHFVNPQNNRSYCQIPNQQHVTRIRTNDGYLMWVYRNNGTNLLEGYNNLTTDWVKEYLIDDKENYYTIAFRKEDNSDFEGGEDVATIVFGNVYKELAEIKNSETDTNYPYAVSGERIDVIKQQYRTSDLGFGAHSWINQGMAIHNGIAFNLSSTDGNVYLYDLNTYNFLTNYAITGGHASSACFSNEYYESTDEFPLLYINDCYEPKIYINRVTRTEATLIKTLYFGTNAEIGYYTAHAFDVINKRLYMLAYTQNSFYASSDNPMIFSVWNMANLTQNEDGTYTPLLIEKTNINSINCVQDVKFFNGKIVVMSSTDSASDTEIYCINPITKLITTTMTDFGSDLKSFEVEGFDFVLNADGTKYDIICSPIYKNFYEIEFN